MTQPYLFKTKAVRDLYWSCFGPELVASFGRFSDNKAIKHCHIQLNTRRLNALLQLDLHPQPLYEALANLSSRRLGLYHEALWRFFIQQDPQLTLISGNRQVFDGDRTLGEFDLIYYSHQSCKYYHLELAVKFYLNTDSIKDSCNNKLLSNYLGPNCTDRFDIKLHHMLNHQIQLSDTYCGKQSLRELGIDFIEKEVSVKGFLFYRNSIDCSETKPGQSTANDGLADDHSRAIWQYLRDFVAEKYQHWLLLEKPDWLGRALCTESADVDQLIGRDNLTEFLASSLSKHSQAIMLCAMEIENDTVGRDPIFVERERYLITPDNWPHKRADLSGE